MTWIGYFLAFVLGNVCGLVLKVYGEKDKRKVIESNEKNRELFNLMNKWVLAKQKKCDFEDYFKKRGINSVAVYGVSDVGEAFINELQDSEISVLYGIDRNPEETNSVINTVSPDDELDEIDAVVVTPIFYFDEIEELLSKKLTCPIISVEDIVTDVLYFENIK